MVLKNKAFLLLGIVYLKIALALAKEECMFTGGLVRIAVFTYCEDGYHCCENNSQFWVLAGDRCQYTGSFFNADLYGYCEEGYTCCPNQTECCKDETLSTAAIVGIVLGTLFVVTIIGGVAGAMWYNYSKRSSRVESVNLQGDVESVDIYMPGPSTQPPPYEQPVCAPPNYPEAVTISDLTAESSNPTVSNANIPMYKM